MREKEWGWCKGERVVKECGEGERERERVKSVMRDRKGERVGALRERENVSGKGVRERERERGGCKGEKEWRRWSGVEKV